MKKLGTLEDMILLGEKLYKAPINSAEERKTEKPSVHLQARLTIEKEELEAGENIDVDIELINIGKTPVLLIEAEDIIPQGFELVSKPRQYDLEGTNLDMNGRRLDPLLTEEFKVTLRSFERGLFVLKPKIVYMDDAGRRLSCVPQPVTVNIAEDILPCRISTGYKDFDRLLLGGLPENYAVVLTSVSCDETDLLIKKFLEEGVNSSQVTFHVTIDASGVKNLAEKSQSHFYLFVCNPQADTIIRNLPNVFKLKGVENLTDISIALTSAFHTLAKPPEGQRRACIEIISDVLLEHHAIQTRKWLSGLIPELRSVGFTTLAVMNPLMHSSEETHAILDLFEGEISVCEEEGNRILAIRKMYGQRYLNSKLTLRKEKLKPALATRKGKWMEF
jgi:KaiC/GvpD/RAD55 family RecA-like ATPase